MIKAGIAFPTAWNAELNIRLIPIKPLNRITYLIQVAPMSISSWLSVKKPNQNFGATKGIIPKRVIEINAMMDAILVVANTLL